MLLATIKKIPSENFKKAVETNLATKLILYFESESSSCSSIIFQPDKKSEISFIIFHTSLARNAKVNYSLFTSSKHLGVKNY